ncbi:Hsp20/alpha crystallin family protein [Actinokineospora globicatena]|uniref:Hsp20/alpha crystallin family protein n=1 Tax=Actinokineospora globicatena TaxID=103729 RepID=UPI003D7FD4F9
MESSKRACGDPPAGPRSARTSVRTGTKKPRREPRRTSRDHVVVWPGRTVRHRGRPARRGQRRRTRTALWTRWTAGASRPSGRDGDPSHFSRTFGPPRVRTAPLVEVDRQDEGPVPGVAGRCSRARAGGRWTETLAPGGNHYGLAARSVTLPRCEDVDAIKAACRDGVLELRVPLRESPKGKQIPVTDPLPSRSTQNRATSVRARVEGAPRERHPPVLAAVDGSSSSTAAVAWAAGARLVAVCCIAARAGAPRCTPGHLCRMSSQCTYLWEAVRACGCFCARGRPGAWSPEPPAPRGGSHLPTAPTRRLSDRCRGRVARPGVRAGHPARGGYNSLRLWVVSASYLFTPSSPTSATAVPSTTARAARATAERFERRLGPNRRGHRACLAGRGDGPDRRLPDPPIAPPPTNLGELPPTAPIAPRGCARPSGVAPVITARGDLLRRCDRERRSRRRRTPFGGCSVWEGVTTRCWRRG